MIDVPGTLRGIAAGLLASIRPATDLPVRAATGPLPDAAGIRKVHMPPDISPHARHPAGVVPTHNYLPDDPVWIYHGGAWLAGVIVDATPVAATVTFRMAGTDGTDGTGMDTVTAPYLLARFDHDPSIDRTAPAGPGTRGRTVVPSNYPYWRHTVR